MFLNIYTSSSKYTHTTIKYKHNVAFLYMKQLHWALFENTCEKYNIILRYLRAIMFERKGALVKRAFFLKTETSLMEAIGPGRRQLPEAGIRYALWAMRTSMPELICTRIKKLDM